MVKATRAVYAAMVYRIRDAIEGSIHTGVILDQEAPDLVVQCRLVRLLCSVYGLRACCYSHCGVKRATNSHFVVTESRDERKATLVVKDRWRWRSLWARIRILVLLARPRYRHPSLQKRPATGVRTQRKATSRWC